MNNHSQKIQPININLAENNFIADNCVHGLNQEFETLTAIERIEKAAEVLPDNIAMTSSFGIDSAVSLHLINQVIPGIKVILIDTGYLFKETYQYAETLQQSLNLNLHIHQSSVSAARFESQYGQLWLNGIEGLDKYNQLRKVQPLNQAMSTLNIKSWFSGVRRTQSNTRQQLPWISCKNHRYKVHPLLDWSDRDIFLHAKQHQLPAHPLSNKGYLTVGDTHSTQSIHEVNDLSELRFSGLKRECGIHE
jgi:phosphoadenosine phosphosulfate reductase